jgi:hypothetical protein
MELLPVISLVFGSYEALYEALSPWITKYHISEYGDQIQPFFFVALRHDLICRWLARRC